MKTFYFSVIFLIFFLSLSVSAKTADEAIEDGLKWLRSNQKEDGSFSSYPSITALVCSAFLKANYNENDETVRKGINFILKCVKPDGSIYLNDMPAYNTSICLVTLVETKNPKYESIIKNARKWLESIQVGAKGEVESVDKFYGGIGYDSHMKPDLSNLQHALEALKLTEIYSSKDNVIDTGPFLHHEHKDDVFDRAIIFLQRCQNLKISNDQSWAGNDGGFIYSSDGESKAGGTQSYGSMTYAGLKSFIYCRVGRDDPRVVAAYNWIRNYYTLDENPFMGKQGLYYYYHTFSKALSVYGEKIIKDFKGIEHNWAKELIEKLVSLQNKEGYWVNDIPRWWEDNKELVTAYSILALQNANNFLNK
jgi:squalene-hopene/tetraprenyl-beta-curcumene cyclase